jgi:hypothetical protein
VRPAGEERREAADPSIKFLHGQTTSIYQPRQKERRGTRAGYSRDAGCGGFDFAFRQPFLKPWDLESTGVAEVPCRPVSEIFDGAAIVINLPHEALATRRHAMAVRV